MLLSLLLATDFTFLVAATTGRADIMSFALASAALAVWARLRSRNLALALFAGHSLTAASGLTHPNGGMAAFAAIVLATIWFDRRRLSLAVVLAAILPYVLGSAGWAAYVLQRPDYFAAQFFSSAQGRLGQALTPWGAFAGELGRYANSFGAGSDGVARVRLLVPIVYLGALAGAFLPRVRRERAVAFLLAAVALQFALLALFEGSKQPWYLLHLLPFLLCLAAVTGYRIWTSRSPWRLAALAGAVTVVLLQVGPLIVLTSRDGYRTYYVPVGELLNKELGPGDVAVGSAELGFAIGFDRLFDDRNLGCAVAGYPTPKILVIDSVYAAHVRWVASRDSDLSRCIQARLSVKYAPVYSNRLYAVYSRVRPPDSGNLAGPPAGPDPRL